MSPLVTRVGELDDFGKAPAPLEAPPLLALARHPQRRFPPQVLSNLMPLLVLVQPFYDRDFKADERH